MGFPSDEQIAKAVRNTQKIIDTLDVIVKEGKPYKKQLILMTKNYPKFTLSSEDVANLIHRICHGTLPLLWDKFFFYDDEGKTFFFDDGSELQLDMFKYFSGNRSFETTLEFLFTSVLIDIEHFFADYPEYLSSTAGEIG